ncbi:hypothetical protein GCM10010518_56200 [Kitasatospora cinereorecta]
MTEEDADLSALVAERLGSREDRHRGLLFMSGTGRAGGVQKDYLTVRDRADTDQGRHRPSGVGPRRTGPRAGRKGPRAPQAKV